MAYEIQPQVLVQPWDYSPVVGILVWLNLAFAVLAVLMRVCMKYVGVGQLAIDDLWISLALVFAVAQSALILSPGGSHIGKASSKLSLDDTDAAQKTLYASSLLYTISNCCSRLSVLAFTKAITPVKSQTQALRLITGYTLFLALSGFIALAAQCQIPAAWKPEPGRCFDRLAFVVVFDVLCILNDLALVVLPAVIVYPLHMPINKRLIVICCFASRILVVAATCTEMAFAQTAFSSSDFVFSIWPCIAAGQFTQGFAIITACVPCLKRFVGGVESGYLRFDDHRRREQAETYNREQASKDMARHYYVDVSRNSHLSVPLNVIRTYVSAQARAGR